MNTEIGNKIRELRSKNDWTLRELSSKIGATFQLISKWEQGKHQPSMKYLIMLSNLFSIDVSEFFKEEKMKELTLGMESRRRSDDVDYSLVLPLRNAEPEVIRGKPMLKLLLLREVFCSEYANLDDMAFMRVETYAFMPGLFPGNILFIDRKDHSLRDGLYILKFNGQLLLREIRPIDATTSRVTHRPDSTTGWVDQNTEELKQNIVGRVVGIYKRT